MIGQGMFEVRSGDLVIGRLRLVWGVTGPTHRERLRRSRRSRFLFVRLWDIGKGDGRLVGVQWLPRR